MKSPRDSNFIPLIKYLVAASFFSCVATHVAASNDISVRYIDLDQTSSGNYLSLSADGRYVAYNWFKNSYRNIALHDLETNTRIPTVLKADGTEPNIPNCGSPAISGNARYVVFGCNSAAMGTENVSGGFSYYVYDKLSNKTEILPVSSSNTINIHVTPAINEDGRFIAYRSGISTSAAMFVRDTVNKNTKTTGAKYTGVNTTPRFSSISQDGRYVAYTGIGAASSNAYAGMIYDNLTGATEVLNLNSAGVPSASPIFQVMLSSDGNIAVFQSADSGLVSPRVIANNGFYVRDRRVGKTEFVDTGVVVSGHVNASISANGRYIAFQGTREGVPETFVYDRLTRVTRTVPGTFGAGRTPGQTKLSANGRYLVFASKITTSGAPLIGIADLGVEAGLTISSTSLSVQEGGDAATYSLSLAQAPTNDVVVTLHHDKQLSLARTELTFTSANWSVPQIVSVRAVADGVAEGEHVSTITHSIASKDLNYSVVVPANITVKISDGVKPTISTPGSIWNRSEMPVGGTAAPGATVILTAVNRTTGWMSAVSTVADAQGKWSYTLTGFTNGVIEIDAQADGAKAIAPTVTVTLATAPPQPTYTDVTGYIRTTAYGLVRNRSTGLYAGDFVLTNSGSIMLKGPLHLQFNELTSTATLVNATGSNAGAPYITVTGDLAPDQSVTIPLLFTNPDRVTLHYDAKIFSGTF